MASRIDGAQTLREVSTEDMKHNTTYMKCISVKREQKLPQPATKKQTIRHDVETQSPARADQT